MAFTYDLATHPPAFDGDDADRKRNALRFLLDDRVESLADFTDEELNAWLSQWASVWQAAAELADMVVGGGLKLRHVSTTKIEYYRNMAPTWRNRARSHQAPILVKSGENFFTEEGGSYDSSGPATIVR